MKYKRDINLDRYKYIYIKVIGAGGTNGYVIPSLSRLLYSINKSSGYKINDKTFIIDIYDFDTVEEKNLLRQNFIIDDLGKHKARVLADRYGSFFDIFYNVYIEKASSVYSPKSGNFDINGKEVRYLDSYLTIIVEAVDNNLTRKLIHNSISGYDDVLWISSGNDDKTGQIVISKYEDWNIAQDVTTVWPNSFNADSLEREKKEIDNANLNCAINSELNPQSISINQTAANLINNIIYSIFYEFDIDYDILLFDNKNSVYKYTYENIFPKTDSSKSNKLKDIFNINKKKEYITPIIDPDPLSEIEVNIDSE